MKPKRRQVRAFVELRLADAEAHVARTGKRDRIHSRYHRGRAAALRELLAYMDTRSHPGTDKP